MNRLILGDNLEILKKLEAESVDLIYLDPPFFSNRNYEVIWGDAGEIRSFKDRWAGGLDGALSDAVIKENFEIVQFLVSKGAKVSVSGFFASEYRRHSRRLLRLFFIIRQLRRRNDLLLNVSGNNVVTQELNAVTSLSARH